MLHSRIFLFFFVIFFSRHFAVENEFIFDSDTFKTFMSEVVQGQNLDEDYVDQFVEYVENFNKAYSYDLEDSEEVAKRYSNFITSDKYIKSRNALGTLSYTLGHTKFSDWSDEERKAIVLDSPRSGLEVDFDDCTLVSFDESEDYDYSNFTSYDIGIQDQGSCSSCWDFSSTGMIEINRNIQTGVQEKLSEQYVIDCTPDDIGSCDGGYPILASLYAQKEGGLATEDCYGEYTGEESSTCDNTCELVGGDFDSVYCFSDATNDQLKVAASEYVLSFGFAVYIDFYFYTDGVYTCEGDSTSSFVGWHAVSIIGIQSEYYIVKNSWGEDWGLDGYVHMDSDTAFSSCSFLDESFVCWDDYCDGLTTYGVKKNNKFKNKNLIKNEDETIQRSNVVWIMSICLIGLILLALGIMLYICYRNNAHNLTSKNDNSFITTTITPTPVTTATATTIPTTATATTTTTKNNHYHKGKSYSYGAIDSEKQPFITQP